MTNYMEISFVCQDKFTIRNNVPIFPIYSLRYALCLCISPDTPELPLNQHLSLVNFLLKWYSFSILKKQFAFSSFGHFPRNMHVGGSINFTE